MNGAELRPNAQLRRAMPPGIVSAAIAGRVQTSATVPRGDFWIFASAIVLHPSTLAELVEPSFDVDPDFPRDCAP